jgi:hypothetical protein
VKLTLDAIVNGGDLTRLTRHELAALLAAAAAIQGRIAAAPAELESTSAPVMDDQYLDAKETAVRLGVHRTWLYRRARKLPFATNRK